MSARKIQILIVIAIAFFLGNLSGRYSVNWEWANYKPNVTVVNREPPTSASLVDFSLFWNVWDKLLTNYYDKTKVDPQKLLYGAINGMVQSVGDPYTMFLPPQAQSNFNQEMSGQFEGIGAELGQRGSQIIIISPLAGSPAEKAGIKAGDAILAVDHAPTQGWSLPQAVNKIRGPKGTKVVLTVQRKNEKNTQDISITRDTITVKSVNGFVKKVSDIPSVNLSKASVGQDFIVYVQLAQFGDATNKDWESLMSNLNSEAQKDNAKGMILDLRNNPGGYLNDAQFVAGEFLPQGATVVKEQDESGNVSSLYVNRSGKFLDIPLVVLINKGSASAAEIVSGGLRDNNRAKLVGETSFGKGTVQEAIDLGNGAGMHVTIAKWLTPKGNWVGNGVNGTGLVPDFSVLLDSKDSSHDTQLEKAIEVVLGQ